jgi:hypothetical protein
LLRAVWDAAFDAKIANPPYDTFSEIKPPRHITAGWNFGEGQSSKMATLTVFPTTAAAVIDGCKDAPLLVLSLHAIGCNRQQRRR